ncbi:Reverse transcriptase (RNA-dependent DNA polymerase) [Popillia japonica]|uniref:Reverse transcriptase (RNA-dependent DNA polymerase) n=1 Tax=Popillia japonica TaxID=7064 RepID=A0AAW1JCX4_POPJA
MLLIYAVAKGWNIKHADFTAAFLNSTIKETIYMKQPPGFVKGNKVCRLNKTIYGLKQSSKEWKKILTLNQSCIKLITDAKREIGLKHTEVKLHFVKDQIQKENCEIKYIESENQIADILTKPLKF